MNIPNRHLLVLLLLLLPLIASADISFWSYYLSGIIRDKNNKPIANAEVKLVQGSFVRQFKTDSSGRYRVEVSYAMGCMSGGKTKFDKVSKQTAQEVNGSRMTFFTEEGSATVPAVWQRFYARDNMHVYASDKNAKRLLVHTDVTLKDTQRFKGHLGPNILPTYEQCRYELEKACGQQLDARSIWEYEMPFNNIMLAIEFRNRHINDIPGFFGCDQWIKIKKRANPNEYEILSPFSKAWTVHRLTTDSRGIIKEYEEIERWPEEPKNNIWVNMRTPPDDVEWNEQYTSPGVLVKRECKADTQGKVFNSKTWEYEPVLRERCLYVSVDQVKTKTYDDIPYAPWVKGAELQLGHFLIKHLDKDLQSLKLENYQIIISNLVTNQAGQIVHYELAGKYKDPENKARLSSAQKETIIKKIKSVMSTVEFEEDFWGNKIHPYSFSVGH